MKHDRYKICEIQPGNYSAFRGYDFLHKTSGLVATQTCDFLEKYGHKLYVQKGTISEPSLHKEMIERNFTSFRSIDDLYYHLAFVSDAISKVDDPSHLNGYRTLLITKPISPIILNSFRNLFPSVLILNECSFPFWWNKLKFAKLFQKDNALANIRPYWKLFTKSTPEIEYLESHHSFATEYIVLKPLDSAEGNGVLLLKRLNLPQTIEMIRHQTSALDEQSDSAYRYWKDKQHKPFVVEEYHFSDPITVAHLGNKEFDPTMRVAFMLWYESGQVSIDFIEMHWKLPKKGLNENGSFSEKHKSHAESPYYALVDSKTEEIVKQTMLETMPLLFLRMIKEN